MMYEVKSVIRPERVAAVVHALHEIPDVPGLTISVVRGLDGIHPRRLTRRWSSVRPRWHNSKLSYRSNSFNGSSRPSGTLQDRAGRATERHLSSQSRMPSKLDRGHVVQAFCEGAGPRGARPSIGVSQGERIR